MPRKGVKRRYDVYFTKSQSEGNMLIKAGVDYGEFSKRLIDWGYNYDMGFLVS